MDIESASQPGIEVSPGRKLAGLGVHVFTASGAVLGLLALVAAVEGRYATMFAWLGVALFVDGIDGSIARAVGVRRVAPRFSGEVLDLVVDYVTYVLVPAYALAMSGLLPHGFGMLGGAMICFTSALYFADTKMKTADWYFRGFPAVWNAVAFYVFLYEPPVWLSFAVVVALSVATFAPIVFVHPFRVVRLRILTLFLLAAWAVLATYAVFAGMRPDAWTRAALGAIGLYFLGAGLLRPLFNRD